MKKKAASKSNDDALLFSIIEGIEEVKGHDIKILDLRNIESAIADYFVVCTGTSTTQVEAIARSAENFTRKELDEKPRRVEGLRNAQWVLMDYFSIIVHIFYEPMRDHYDIEGLWADADEMALPKKVKPKAEPKLKAAVKAKAEPKAKAAAKPKAEPKAKAAVKTKAVTTKKAKSKDE
ncbi:MAG: ribosome silencing factor [Bacteroidota bacterium]|jgi:ribosome-associated protein